MSKSLEALEKIVKTMSANHFENQVEELSLIEKELKALEILRNKRVNLEYLKCCETYEQYKTVCSYWDEINQEEYNLLKEVLKK